MMDENKPSLEPIGYGEDNNGWYLIGRGEQIAYGLTEEQARRIVACVNACVCVPTEMLEQAASPVENGNLIFRELLNAWGELDHIKQQRDQLLAICKNFEIQDPDSDGFVWLVLHGAGTTGKAMVNLGKDGMLVVQVAQHLEADRKAAIAAVEQPAAEPATDADGWIEWNGGECPVDGDVLVQCKLRNGMGWHMETRCADEWDWSHDDGIFEAGDIVAYRVVQEGGAA